MNKTKFSQSLKPGFISARPWRILLLAALVVGGLSRAAAQPGSLDFSFNPGDGTDNLIFSVAVQADGKVLIGGQFNSVNGTNRNRIARLHPNGSLDTTFDPGTGADGPVNSVALQADGKVLVGGSFSSINGTTRKAVARLNTNGLVDAAFVPAIGDSSAYLNAVAALPDGRVMIGGNFSSVNGDFHQNIARLNSNGTVDTSFDPVPYVGPDTAVNAMAVQSNGYVVIGGFFSDVNSEDRNGIARLRANGSLDTGFVGDLGAGGGSYAIGLDANGKVLAGGSFTSATTNGIARQNIARFHYDGSLDTNFGSSVGPNGDILALALQPDNKVLIGGFFTDGIARLTSNGAPDTNFNPGSGVSGTVRAIAVQSDAKVVIGGGYPTVNGTARNNIARLNGESVLEFAAAGFFALENAGVATVTVRRLGDTNSTVSVNYATSNETATAGSDYTSTNGSLTFSPGQTNRTFSIFLLADGLGEFNETFRVNLSSPSAGAQLGAATSATVTLIETNFPGVLGLEASDFQVNESDGNIQLRVRRTGGGTNVLSVNYATSNGTATASSDYLTTSGLLTFGPADASKTMTVPIVDDWPIEGSETFSVRLSNPAGGAVLGVVSEASVTILDAAFSLEDLYGHSLFIEKLEDLFVDESFSSFSNRLTIRNPSLGASMPGFVELTISNSTASSRFNLASIPGGGSATVIVGWETNAFSACDGADPDTCSLCFFATVYEHTTNGPAFQDRELIFCMTNSSPPTGGVPCPEGCVPGTTNPLPYVTNLFIVGPAVVEEGAVGKFTATAQLSNGSVNTNATVTWSSSAFSMSGGNLLPRPITNDTLVTITAARTAGSPPPQAAKFVTVLNLNAQLDQALRLANGSFRARLTGPSNRVYAIEASTNLVNWTNLIQLTNRTGSALFTNQAPLPNRRFYRALER